MKTVKKIISCIKETYSLEIPTFLCVAGRSGCGKTMILHEIQAKAEEKRGIDKVLFIEAFEILNQIIRRSYYDCELSLEKNDLVLIDQFEDISGLYSTQLVFFDMIRTLLKQGVSVAVSLCVRADNRADNELHKLLLFKNFCENQYHVIISPADIPLSSMLEYD